MDSKKMVTSVIAVMVFAFIYDWIVHGMLLMPIYEATANVWRPQAESNMWFMLLSQFAYAFMFTYIYASYKAGADLAESAKFGGILGCLLAATQIGTYCYLPIPGMLTVWWMVASICSGIGIGAVLSFTYKR